MSDFQSAGLLKNRIELLKNRIELLKNRIELQQSAIRQLLTQLLLQIWKLSSKFCHLYVYFSNAQLLTQLLLPFMSVFSNAQLLTQLLLPFMIV